MTQLSAAKNGKTTSQMERVAQREGQSVQSIREELAAGRLVIPANPKHCAGKLDPCGIGRSLRTKINANIGVSAVSSDAPAELAKLCVASKFGADTVMDLSVGNDLDAIRQRLLDNSSLPLGTVPIYQVVQENPQNLEQFSFNDIMAVCEKQAVQGVDFFTIHAGIRREHLELAEKRLAGIVSRGGALLGKWMIANNQENPLYEHFDELCKLLAQYDVVISIGDALRPGCLADATDEAQIAELRTIGELTERAQQHGVQVIVEGPGHIPLDQIEYNMKLQDEICNGAPFYVLGPIVTDIAPGYDHVTSAIGATSAAFYGASFLCYVTPVEHLCLPNLDEVKQGVIVYRIAAHAADVARGLPGARQADDAISKARADLDWEKQFELSVDPELARSLHQRDLPDGANYCGMCGADFCPLRLNKEIHSSGSAN
ncbi:MAG: phosphomethylpyrimidine synthase ThiC [Actinobacteria bacterium]|nr:phosphomethylpyrimidine synthase ThiC [Actinomycetota bacterium]